MLYGCRPFAKLGLEEAWSFNIDASLIKNTKILLALQDHGHSRRNVVGHQGRNADAQIDVLAVTKLARRAHSQLFSR